MRTVQEIFDIAIHLMDAQNESNGATDNAEAKEYQMRTPNLLNSILDRAYLASDTMKPGLPGVRPVCPKVSAMEDVVEVDERVATGVLPYGLAGLLLTEEDPGRADYFWQTFLEQLRECMYSCPATVSEVEDCYGGIEHGQYADW